MKLPDTGLSPSDKKVLAGMGASSRLPHAVLIEGAEPQARAGLSGYIACCAVCSSADRPCGVCENCRKALEGIHPDVIVYDPADENEKTFKVKAVRELRDRAFIMPNEAENKVMILRQADKMNAQAQNALLKIIEEPPEHVIFILECESGKAMLPTILSRVASFAITGKAEDSGDKLKAEAYPLAGDLLNALMKPTELEFMRLTAGFEKKPELFEPTISAMKEILRDASAKKAGSAIALTDNGGLIERLGAKFSLKTILRINDKLTEFEKTAKTNANKNLLFTRFSSILRCAAYNIKTDTRHNIQ